MENSLEEDDSEQQGKRELPTYIQKAHPFDNVLSDREYGMMTRRRLATEL